MTLFVDRHLSLTRGNFCSRRSPPQFVCAAWVWANSVRCGERDERIRGGCGTVRSVAVKS